MLPKLLLNSMPVNRSLLEQFLPFYSSFAWYAELFSWDRFLMFPSTSGCEFHFSFHNSSCPMKSERLLLILKPPVAGNHLRHYWLHCLVLGVTTMGRCSLKSSVGDWGTDWLLSLWQGNLTDRRFSSQKASLLWGYIFGLITSAAPGDGRYAASKGECNWKAKPRKQRNNVRKADD